MSTLPRDRSAPLGVALGAAAYLLWGTFPIYFKALGHVPATEVLAHRVFWSFLFMLLVVTIAGRSKEIRRALSTPRTALLLCTSTVLIASNWLLFIHAVQQQRILDASLGYFMNPLINVALGRWFLRERLHRAQLLSLALALLGVSVLIARHGTLPWLSLLLALSFGGYGLVRKVVAIDPLTGLFTETALLMPIALAHLVWLMNRGSGSFAAGSVHDDVLLGLAGIITAIPLLLFTAAARRLRLSTLGFLQFLSPSLQFALAVAVYHERFSWPQMSAFLCIWSGLALFSVDAVRRSRRVAVDAEA